MWCIVYEMVDKETGALEERLIYGPYTSKETASANATKLLENHNHMCPAGSEISYDVEEMVL